MTSVMERSRGSKGPEKPKLSQRGLKKPGLKKPILSQPGPSQTFGSRDVNGRKKEQEYADRGYVDTGITRPSSMMTSENNSCTRQGDDVMHRKRGRRVEKRRDDDIEQTIASSTATSSPPVNQDNTQPGFGLVRQDDDEGSSTKLKRGQRGHFKGINIHKKTKGGNKKLEVHIPDHIGQALGPNARDLANHCGYVVRTTVPVNSKSWEDAIEEYGETMMKQVEEKFQLTNSDPNTFKLREYCKETMHRLFRVWRSRLHTIYKSYETDEERLKNKPHGLSDEQWQSCLVMFASPEFMKKSQTNSENRLKSKCRHTTGNLTFSEFEEKLTKENDGVKPTADIIWLKEHTKRNQVTGQLEYSKEDSGSKEVYLKLNEMVAETTKEGGSELEQEEMLLRIFQPRSGYVRGKGNGYEGHSKRAAIAAECHRQQQTIATLRNEVEELKAEGKRRDEENRKAYDDLRKEVLAMLAVRNCEASTSGSPEYWTDDFIT